MIRERFWIDGPDGRIAATLDLPGAPPRALLLIVSGGNEIRSGAFAGQAALGTALAAAGHAVVRFDPPGVGDSQGKNGGFGARGPALAAVAQCLTARLQGLPLLLFGNCDGATLIALHGAGLGAAGWLLANPWVIEAAGDDGDDPEEEHPAPPAAAIRARYLRRLARPDRLLADVVSGRIDFGKLAGGLGRLAKGDAPGALAGRIGEGLAGAPCPVTLLIAGRDTTALAFLSAWRGPDFAAARARADVVTASIDSASHGFADAAARDWLTGQLRVALDRVAPDGAAEKSR